MLLLVITIKEAKKTNKTVNFISENLKCVLKSKVFNSNAKTELEYCFIYTIRIKNG